MKSKVLCAVTNIYIKDNNGVITCPLHGLKYSVKTKKLVKQ